MMRSALLSIFLVLSSSLVSVTTQAAARAPWTSSKIKGTPFPPLAFQIRPVYPGLRFTRPSSIEEIPGANRLILTEIGGKIHSIAKENTTAKPELVIDLSAVTGGGATAWDTDFHPNFLENRFIYVAYAHPAGGRHSRVSRFVLSDTNPPKILPETEKVIIKWPSGGHNGGCLEFGNEGYLYVSTGDGSGPNPPDALTTGQDVTDLLGAILRLDVDHTDGDLGYRVPPDNPFVGHPNARPEIWAYGFRNPWKIGVDKVTGEVFAADNGWETWEIVHRATRGSNGGWPVMEGPDVLRSEVTPGPTPITPPFKAHPHTEANSVIGGPVYRGALYPDLHGWFIYGDYITGTIWAVTPNDDGTTGFQTLADTDLRLSSLTEGSKGEVYLVDYDSTEQIYELVPTPAEDKSQAPFPTKLSETGIFQSMETLTPMPGVVPYDVQVPRWMDGASARRWIAIPEQGTVSLANGDQVASYPEGTVLAKHLEFPQSGDEKPLRLETQLLHFEQGSWRPYSYVWNDEGSDATLADATGMDRALGAREVSDIRVPETWHVSAQNECRLCHNADAGYVLGFSPNQLQNHLTALKAQQVLDDTPAVATNEVLVDPHDATQSLDDRARSYLHANCAMCHRPGGSVIASFFLRRDLSFEELNTNKGTGVGTFGMRNAKVIAGGDPFRSVLMYRMSKLGYSRMPYIGTRTVDSKGIGLISKWIQSLAPDPNDTDLVSPPLSSNTAEANALNALSHDQGANEREQTIRLLTASTEGSLALVTKLHNRELSEGTSATAIAIGNEASDPNIRGLFETFVAESARKSRLGSHVDPSIILRLTGDAAKGKTIFYSAGALCKTCHHPTDKTLSLGTTLAEIRIKYPQRSELLRHILEPSLSIDDAYRNHTLELTNGTLLQGIIAEQTETAYVIKTAELEEYTIPKAEVRTTRASEQSPMPNGVLSDLSAQDAADLLAFIQSVPEVEN